MDVSDFFGSGAGKREEAPEQVAQGGGRFLLKLEGWGGLSEEEEGGGAQCHEDVWKEEGGGLNIFFRGRNCPPITTHHSIQIDYRQTSFLRQINVQSHIQDRAARRVDFHYRSRSVGMSAENLSLQICRFSLEFQFMFITPLQIQTSGSKRMTSVIILATPILFVLFGE